MNNKKIIKKQLVNNMTFNFILFTIVFSIFGIIIYGIVSKTIYQSADNELLNKTLSSSITAIPTNSVSDVSYKMETNINSAQSSMFVKEISLNPRVIEIIRDENGNILQGGFMHEKYMKDIKFDKNNIANIYEMTLNNEYKYRAINYKTFDMYGNLTYRQVLINVDAENDILSKFSTGIIIAIITTTVLSIIASYIISKKSLKPLALAWKKQNEFIQNASHELRTPLTIITTKQELLLKNPENKIIEKSENILLTLQETKRLTKLIEDLMTLAKGDSEIEKLNKQKMNLNELIKKVSEPYIEMAEIQNKKFLLDLKYEKNILLDKDKIYQLFIILLDNAMKYTSENETINVLTYEKDNKCIVEIKDTGIGMSDEGIERIFERFYREDKARNRESGGNGIGMSIADLIVDMHGGSIKVKHNDPKGLIIEIKFKNQ